MNPSFCLLFLLLATPVEARRTIFWNWSLAAWDQWMQSWSVARWAEWFAYGSPWNAQEWLVWFLQNPYTTREWTIWWLFDRRW